MGIVKFGKVYTKKDAFTFYFGILLTKRVEKIDSGKLFVAQN
jgi:hypothetical protein